MSDVSSEPGIQPRVLPNWASACLIVVGVISLFFVAQLLGGVILGIYAGLQHWSSSQIDHWLTTSTEAQFAYGLIAEGSLIVGVGFGLRWLHWSWASIGLLKPKLRHLLYGLLAVVPYFIFYIALATVIGMIFPSLNVNQKQEIGFSSASGTFGLTLAFIGLVILPAVAEEITMRGFLYTELKKWLPTVVAALVVSLLFGAAHLAEGGDSGPLWIGAIDTFTLSLVLVFLREKTGNLWAGIVLHAVKNAIAFAAIFFIK